MPAAQLLQRQEVGGLRALRLGQPDVLQACVEVQSPSELLLAGGALLAQLLEVGRLWPSDLPHCRIALLGGEPWPEADAGVPR